MAVITVAPESAAGQNEIRSYLYGRDNNCSAKTKAILNCAHNIMQISS